MIVKSVGKRKPSLFSSTNCFVRLLLPPKCQVYSHTIVLTQPDTPLRIGFAVGHPLSYTHSLRGLEEHVQVSLIFAFILTKSEN